MRLTISREGLCGHEGSMRCERCFSHVIEGEKEGACVISQEDDGVDLVTLTIVGEGGEASTYLLPQEAILPILGESWPVVIEAIGPYRQA